MAVPTAIANHRSYNPDVVRRANDKPGLRAVQGYGEMRERGSEAEWFTVEFLVYYDGSQLRAFAYVRRKDGIDIPDGEYDVREAKTGVAAGGRNERQLASGNGVIDGAAKVNE